MLIAAAQKQGKAANFGKAVTSKRLCSLLAKDLSLNDEINNVKGKLKE